MSKQVMQRALEAFVWNLNTDLDNIPACEQWAKMLKKNISDLTEALQALEQNQVPSAWRYKDSGRICDNSDKRMTAPPDWVPLFTAPTPRKPLTDEALHQVIRAGNYDSMEQFARAIERAHGIGK